MIKRLIGEAEVPEPRVRVVKNVSSRKALELESSGIVPGSSRTVNGITYYKEDGVWKCSYTIKNPDYYNTPRYNLIYPGPHPYAFIVFKYDPKISSKNFRKSVCQVYKDATGKSWYSAQPGLDGADAAIYERRVSGEKPEPAYEIFEDGTWKRTSKP